MSGAKVRVNLFANDPALRALGGKCLVFPAGSSLSVLLSLASAKLGTAEPAKRLFVAAGTEVLSVEDLKPNEVLYVSQGEDFGCPTGTAHVTQSPPHTDEQATATVTPPPFPWMCSVCTFGNEAGRPKCEICDADAPPLSTIRKACSGSSQVSLTGAVGPSAVVPPLDRPTTEGIAHEDEHAALPQFLRRVNAPVLPGEEEEGEELDFANEEDEEDWSDDEEDDDLWNDYQEYEDYQLAMRLQEELAKQQAADTRTSTDVLYECPICYDDKPLGQMYFIEKCFHQFCMDCLKMHLEVAIKEGAFVKNNQTRVVQKGLVTEVLVEADTGVRCPASGCETILTQGEVRHCTTGILFNRFEQILLSRTIDSSKDMKWCPKTGCGNAIFRSSRSDKLAVCSSCYYTFCFECGDEYHAEDSDCALHAQYKQHRTGIDSFQQWARSQDLRHCPTCHELIEKNLGCDHMFCTQCHTDFSWSEAEAYHDPAGISAWKMQQRKQKEAGGTQSQTILIRRRNKKRRKGARRAGLLSHPRK